MYADSITDSIKKTVDETSRRRKVQIQFNQDHNITPESVRKDINDILSSIAEQDYVTVEPKPTGTGREVHPNEIPKLIKKLTKEMFAAAKNLEFESAAEIRDQIRELEKTAIKYGAA